MVMVGTGLQGGVVVVPHVGCDINYLTLNCRLALEPLWLALESFVNFAVDESGSADLA